MKGASVGINLAAGENGYNLFSLSLSYGDYSIDAVPASIDDISAIPDNELADFKNILSLADIIDENYEINLTASLSAGNISLTADVCINLRTLTLSAKTSLMAPTFMSDTMTALFTPRIKALTFMPTRTKFSPFSTVLLRFSAKASPWTDFQTLA